ncbi:MAG: hypothetical protein ACKOX7_05145 [Bacteroidota bacterium]
MNSKLLIYSLLLFLLAALQTNAQTVVFNEDFENPPGNVTSSGTPGWFINNRLSVSGTNSDSSSISSGATSYLTTGSMNLTGLFYVTLSFKSICKAEFFDGGTLEYSIDGVIHGLSSSTTTRIQDQITVLTWERVCSKPRAANSKRLAMGHGSLEQQPFLWPVGGRPRLSIFPL